eukprot:706989_1
MEKLIPVINDLQDVFTAVGQNPIDLPQIVVVGSQSCGKSSVLENLVGKDFLPRGTGIVTRRPLILQLVHVNGPPNDGDPSLDGELEWAEFLHLEGEKFYDFDKVRQEIAADTERYVGINKGISAKPINLKIVSPKVLNITLVDLPGITKVAVGDQPDDIEIQIREMIFSFISNPNSMILAVTAANADLATSDALQIAKEVDPTGERTLGVITKIDLMDHGCNALDILHGKVVPLKLGYIGIKNRSQLDINNNMSIEDALVEEGNFFRSHPSYRNISTQCGTPYLATCLNRILVHHIKYTLPRLKAQVNSLIGELQKELETYGDPILCQKASQGALILHMLSNFCNSFCDAIDGKCNNASTTRELSGGARISYIFHGIFSRSLSEISPFDTISDQEIRTAIRNSTGPRPSLFVPEVSFELLVKAQIERLREPSLQCVDLVFDELQRVSMQCDTPDIARFTLLRDKIVDTVNALLRKHREPARQMVTDLIHLELAYINTNHPDFIGGSKAVSTTLQALHGEAGRGAGAANESGEDKVRRNAAGRGQALSSVGESASDKNAQRLGRQNMFSSVFGRSYRQDDPARPPSRNSVMLEGRADGNSMSMKSADLSVATDREQIETEIIKSLISSYFSIVKKNVLDAVPKAIMYLLVNQSKKELQSELVTMLYKDKMFDSLLAENPEVAQKRTNCVDLLNILNRALEIVNSVRDFKV